MKDSKRLFAKGISGKRKEGYEAAILAVKSMLKDEFYSQEDQARIGASSYTKGGEHT